MDKIVNTPQEYLSQTNYNLQSKLGIRDTKFLTSGALSVLANTISNVGFDAQKYYEYVTKEFNVATAQEYKSMLFHASVYSYRFNLAMPSEVYTYITVPKVSVPDNRKIEYKIPMYSDFLLNGAMFRIEGEIAVIIDSTTISATLDNGVGIYQLDIYEDKDVNQEDVYYITVPSDKVKQISRYIEKFVVPDYNVGENVSYNIAIPDDNQVVSLNFFVNSYENPVFPETNLETVPLSSVQIYYPELEKFDLKYFKFNTLASEKVLFVNFQDTSNIMVTLGNGLYGYKLRTNDEILTIAEYSMGADGNVPAGASEISGINYYEIDLGTGDTVLSSSVNLKVLTNTPAANGASVSDIEDIRQGILQKITERESLVTPLDFEKYFMDPIDGKLATVVSRQINTASPLISVYNTLKDPYTFDIIQTYTNNDDISILNDQGYVINHEITYNNVDMISPFIYVKNNNNVDSYFKYDDLQVSLTILNIASNPEIDPQITVEWDTDDEYFYFVTTGIDDDNIKVVMYTVIGDFTMDSSNGYRVKIEDDDLLLTKFFTDDLAVNRVKLIRKDTLFTIHEYSVPTPLNIMFHVQQHRIYEFEDGTKKILFVPYVDKSYYDSMVNDVKYIDNLVSYFLISDDSISDKIAYNIFLNQAFMNTIDADDLIEQDSVITNDNDELKAKYSIDISITYDIDAMYSKGLTLLDLKTDINLALLDYYKLAEGNDTKVFVTAIVKSIKEMYPDIIKEVQLKSPLTLNVRPWTKTIDKGDYTIEQLLESVPTYFYYDVNNINILFTIEKK